MRIYVLPALVLAIVFYTLAITLGFDLKLPAYLEAKLSKPPVEETAQPRKVASQKKSKAKVPNSCKKEWRSLASLLEIAPLTPELDQAKHHLRITDAKKAYAIVASLSKKAECHNLPIFNQREKRTQSRLFRVCESDLRSDRDDLTDLEDPIETSFESTLCLHETVAFQLSLIRHFSAQKELLRTTDRDKLLLALYANLLHEENPFPSVEALSERLTQLEADYQEDWELDTLLSFAKWAESKKQKAWQKYQKKYARLAQLYENHELPFSVTALTAIKQKKPRAVRHLASAVSGPQNPTQVAYLTAWAKYIESGKATAIPLLDKTSMDYNPESALAKVAHDRLLSGNPKPFLAPGLNIEVRISANIPCAEGLCHRRTTMGRAFGNPLKEMGNLPEDLRKAAREYSSRTGDNF